MNTPPALRLAYIGFAVIGVAVVAAYLISPSRTVQPTVGSPAPAPAVTGAVPAIQPDFALPGLDGQRHAISEWQGHPKLVNFWATWCVPCRKEIPLLNQMQAEYGPKGLKIIGIAVDFSEDVRKFLKAVPLSYDVLIGEEDAMEAAKAYGVESMALPFSAFVDSHGRIMTVHLGELHDANLRATLEVLLRFDAGQIAPADVPAALAAATATATPSTDTTH